MALPRLLWPVSQPGGGTVAPRTDINATATPPAERNAAVLGLGRQIPLIYGPATIGLRVATVIIHGNDLLVLSVVSHGPIAGIDSVTLDGEALPSGITVTTYLGTDSQTPDAGLVAAFAAQGISYTDALHGIAYYVARIAGGASAELPNLLATVRGRLLYDGRTGLTVYSTCPALALADLLSNTTYGAGRTMDSASVSEVANANDTLVGPVGNQEPHRTLGLVLEQKASAAQWISTLRTYAGCFVDRSGAAIRLIPDAPATVEMSFDASNIIEKSVKIRRRGIANTPTALLISWSDAAKNGQAAEAEALLPGVSTGSLDRIESTLALPGIYRYSQAIREGIERANKLWLSDLEADWSVFDVGLRLQVGAVVALTDDVGLSAKQLRITRVRDKGFGRYDVSGCEYDAAVYCTTVTTAPSTPDTYLPNPGIPPVVTDLILVEENYQPRTGVTETRFRAHWTVPAWPWPLDYRAVFSAFGMPNVERPVQGNEAVSDQVVEGLLYQVQVFSVARGLASSPVTATATAIGKGVLPGNVAAIAAFEVGGEVRVTIGAAIDKDLKFYELRYDNGSLTYPTTPWADIWAAATFVDATPAASGVGGFIATKSIPVGTWRLLVCALDSVDQYSPIPATQSVTVTLDVNSYLVGNHAYTNPTPTGMAEYSLPGDPTRYWVTEDNVPVATKFPNVADTYPDIAATYHAAQTSQLLTEAYDFSLMLAGSWQGGISSEALSGSKTDVISLSPDGSTYTDQAALSAKANARFGKVKTSATGTATLKATLPDITLRIDAVPHADGGQITTNASGPTTITLAVPCAKFKSVDVSPIGTTPCSWRINNLITGATPSFEIYTFNPTTGAQISTLVLWSSETV